MSTMIMAFLPANLFDPDDEDEVLMLINQYQGDPEDRKRLLVDWCKISGAVLDEEMVRAVRGEG